jgi:hypothetical protein
MEKIHVLTGGITGRYLRMPVTAEGQKVQQTHPIRHYVILHCQVIPQQTGSRMQKVKIG